jgi:hypothetical protein
VTEKVIAPEPKNGSTAGPKNRPWDRPAIELALDIRSDEKVVLFTDPSSTYEYPESWAVPRSLNDAAIDPMTVVIFDRTDVAKKQIIACGVHGARMVAICPIDVEHEKYVRRMLASMYPWTEVFTTSTLFGKVLMLSPRGQPYDRDSIHIDGPRN